MTFRVSSVRSDETVCFRGIDGSFRVNILVSFEMFEDPNLTYQLGFEGQIRETGSGIWRSSALLGPATTEMRFWDVEVGTEYDLRFRFLYSNGTIGDWVSSWTDYDDDGNPIQVNTSHVVQGNTQLPPDLATFTVVQKTGSETLEFKWSWNWKPLDLVGVELRYGSTQDWATMTYLGDALGDSFTTGRMPAGDWEFAARPISYAVDPSDANRKKGNYSANPSYQSLTVVPADYAVWRGVWSDGEYKKNEMVYDKTWLMIANKDTSDPAAPQPIGDTYYVIDLVGSPTWVQSFANSDSLLVGQRYVFQTDAYLRSVRVWIPDDTIGFTCEIFLVLDPLGTPLLQSLLTFTISIDITETWVRIPLGLQIIPDGVTFDIIALFVPTVGSNSFTYEWDYERKNGNPDQGKIWHQSGANANQMRVHQEDKDSVNRSSDLDNIQAGSTILMVSSGFEWKVLSSSKSGSVYTFIVDPASRAGEDTSNFTFTYFDTLDIHYVNDDDFYLGTPGIEGLFSTTGPDGRVVNDNAYGIDIEIQEASISRDWDVMSKIDVDVG